MSDPFDKKLVDKINEVFDNFEDDSANESWMELRKRLPEKKVQKPSATIWWLSSAAAILLLCGVWFLTDQKELAKTRITKATDKARVNNIDSTNSQIKSSITPIESKENHTAGNHSIESLESSSRQKVKSHNKSASQPKPVEIGASAKTGIEHAGKSILEESQHDLTLIALVPDPSKKTDSELSANSTLAPDSSRIAASTISNNEIYPSEVISKEQLHNLIQVDKTKQQSRSGNKLTVSVFAGSYFNYAEGSQTSINTGVGLSSDIKISKKLKISTGVSLAQNSLKYDQLIPKEAALNFASSHNANTALDLQSKQGFSTLSYSINSYDAKLLGLDIPINLKYTLLEKKNSIYISTGFSSNLFINESYTYTFEYQMNSSSSTQEPTQQSSSGFQSFDFARVLNFSLGFDHRLNKKSNLIFEPFVKYPLSGLGANDLRFGAAGMNLKLNFNQLK